MEKIAQILCELENINNTYELSKQDILKLQNEFADAKVCMPIIGKFSSGKTALVNRLLGYNRKLLKEDITPETAVPAEIVGTDDSDSIHVIMNDGTQKEITLEQYHETEFNAEKCRSVCFRLRNNFLREIKDIMLVDMPGFESGYEIHNKAIDNYLPESMAYIIAFPADDMIMRESIRNILKELHLYDEPLCVVITKYDKRNEDFENTFAKLKADLKKYVGEGKIEYCITSSVDSETGVEELKRYLRKTQESAQEIIQKWYVPKVLKVIKDTENYLETVLKSSQLTESELSEKQDRTQRQLTNMNEKVSVEQQDFGTAISQCIEEMKGDVHSALDSELSTFVAMSLNGQEIGDHLNMVVRSAVTESVKKRLLPKIERYMRRVENYISTNSIGDVHVPFYFDAEALNKGTTTAVVAGVAGVLIAGPLLGGIIALLAGLISKKREEKKREEAKREIEMKLRSEVFPKVLDEVGTRIEMEVKKQEATINSSIETELRNQQTTLEKALEDVKTKRKEEGAKKEQLESDVRAKLDRLKELRKDLQGCLPDSESDVAVME